MEETNSLQKSNAEVPAKTINPQVDIVLGDEDMFISKYDQESAVAKFVELVFEEDGSDVMTSYAQDVNLQKKVMDILALYKTENRNLPDSIATQIVGAVLVYIQLCRLIATLNPITLMASAGDISKLTSSYATMLRLSGVAGEQRQIKMIAHHHVHRIIETVRGVWEQFKNGILECLSQAVMKNIITQDQSREISILIREHFKNMKYGIKND